nr:recombinase family protein [Hymenobacter citatus]
MAVGYQLKISARKSAQGRLVFNLFASLAEFERKLIRERTHTGLAAARAQSRVGGRRRELSEEAERTVTVAETLYKKQQPGVNEIVQRLRISKVTLYKYLRHLGVVIHSHRKAAAAKLTERVLYLFIGQIP